MQVRFIFRSPVLGMVVPLSSALALLVAHVNNCQCVPEAKTPLLIVSSGYHCLPFATPLRESANDSHNSTCRIPPIEYRSLDMGHISRGLQWSIGRSSGAIFPQPSASRGGQMEVFSSPCQAQRLQTVPFSGRGFFLEQVSVGGSLMVRNPC